MNNNDDIDKLVSLFKERQELGCPTVQCKHVRETLLEQVSKHSYDICFCINVLLLMNDISLDSKVVESMAEIITKKLYVYSLCYVHDSIELCNACTVSKMCADKEIN